jgi:N-acetylglucosaminyldiphosphoundecaprenol N-acetyl-beta-D-mannosaminyltransferase
MSNNTIDILGIRIDNISQPDVFSIVDDAIKDKRQIHLEGVNAGKIVDMQEDESLRQSVFNSDLITADGQSVIWASKFLGKPLKGRLAGIDLMYKLVEIAHQKGYKLFLFGAKEEVVKKVVAIYTEKYGTNIIAGYRNGYFSKEDEPAIARDIANSGANMLFVAITSPIKENFLHENKEVLSDVNLIMGVGGTFDVIAGKTKRAPLWMQNIGLEWFYRFLQEPKRMWKRYLVGNSKFILLVLKEKFRAKK